MDLVLNIYKGKEIEKRYTADTYDIMFGTIEDILGLIDGISLKNLNDDENTDKLIRMVGGLIGTLKPFLKDIFEGVTDEELRRTKVKELVPIFVEVFKYSFSEIGGLSNGKN